MSCPSFESKHMKDWVGEAARAVPDGLAIIEGGRRLTYRELDREVGRAAAWVTSIGVDARSYVGLYAPSVLETVVMIHALIRVGAVVVPLNRRLSAPELAHQVTFVDTIISDKDFPIQSQSTYSLFDYANYHSDTATPPREIHLDDIHALMFTSGTSGKPKPAALTYGNHFYSAVASALRIGTLPDDRWLCCMPLYHMGGLSILLRCALYGTCVVLQNGFDVERVNAAFDHDRVTLVSLVPTMLYRLIDSRTVPPPHLRMALIGGAAATSELVQAAQAAGFPVVTTYGLTETASQVATQTPECTLIKPGSVGKAIPFTEISIVGENGQPVPADEVGEVVVRGPTVMRGYHEHDEATTQTLRGGALHTGDLGYLDEDGDLWLVQRRSDLIVTGGENVYPAEVEAALRTHPAVRDACVVGVAHPEWGQQVAAMLVAVGAVDRTEVAAYLRGRLAGYKIPRIMRIVDALPLTGSGKIARKAVAEALSQEN
jgi:O-succinylbenzoic acid--CoA ligase